MIGIWHPVVWGGMDKQLYGDGKCEKFCFPEIVNYIYQQITGTYFSFFIPFHKPFWMADYKTPGVYIAEQNA